MPAAPRSGAGIAPEPTSTRVDHLGVGLTALLAAAFLGFVLCGAYAAPFMGSPIFDGGTVTWAFAFGLFVIALGVVLTGCYVAVANRQDR